MPKAITTVVSDNSNSDRTAILHIISLKNNFNEILHDVEYIANNFQALQGTGDANSCKRLMIVIDRQTDPNTVTTGSMIYNNGGTQARIERSI